MNLQPIYQGRKPNNPSISLLLTVQPVLPPLFLASVCCCCADFSEGMKLAASGQFSTVSKGSGAKGWQQPGPAEAARVPALL